MSEMKTYSFSIQHPELTVQGKTINGQAELPIDLAKKSIKKY